MFLNIIRSSGVPRRFHQLLDNPTGAQSDPSRAAAVISTGLVTQANAYHSRWLSLGLVQARLFYNAMKEVPVEQGDGYDRLRGRFKNHRFKRGT